MRSIYDPEVRHGEIVTLMMFTGVEVRAWDCLECGVKPVGLYRDEEHLWWECRACGAKGDVDSKGGGDE